MIEAYRDVPKLANHLHLPVQSGSDRILKWMKRGHAIADYINKIKHLTRDPSGISITSDFIVGFPGETEEDFNATLALVDEIDFDQSYSFIYSPRPGTPAANLQDQTPVEVKKARLALLQEKLNQNESKLSQAMIGTHQSVIVLGTSKKDKNILSGRSCNNRVVNFKGDAAIGQEVSVLIEGVNMHTLSGIQV